MSEKKNTTTQKSKIYSVKVYLSLHCNCSLSLHSVCL